MVKLGVLFVNTMELLRQQNIALGSHSGRLAILDEVFMHLQLMWSRAVWFLQGIHRNDFPTNFCNIVVVLGGRKSRFVVCLYLLCGKETFVFVDTRNYYKRCIIRINTKPKRVTFLWKRWWVQGVWWMRWSVTLSGLCDTKTSLVMSCKYDR